LDHDKPHWPLHKPEEPHTKPIQHPDAKRRAKHEAALDQKADQAAAQDPDLSALDSDFIRVLEDLIDALLANGTLRLTDLPPHALNKLNQRKHARQRLRDSLDLLDDEDDLF
jgi:hypothetical protein